MSAANGPVVVTGASGQLGRDLMVLFDEDQVVGVDLPEFDVTDREAVVDMVASLRPSVVINGAAFTAVDACESNADAAMAVNGTAVGYLAEALAETGGHLIQISTDFVFSGYQSEPYVETDEPEPLSVYGHTKLAGEAAAGANATIVRTSWLSGLHGANMVKTVLRLAGEHPTLTFVDDQRGHPSFAADIAPVIVRLAAERPPGVFHLTNQRAVSWYEFAREVLEVGGHDPDRVHPIATADFEPRLPARRPENSVLDNRALREAGWPPTRDFREPLTEMVRELQH